MYRKVTVEQWLRRSGLSLLRIESRRSQNNFHCCIKSRARGNPCEKFPQENYNEENTLDSNR